MNYQPFSEMVEANGKTVRQNNMAIAHAIPLGTLVEVDIDDDKDCGKTWLKGRARMYVFDHHRDCDGSPLYRLSMLPPDTRMAQSAQTMRDIYREELAEPGGHYSSRALLVHFFCDLRRGYTADSLTVVKSERDV